jgi:hypothetical protein
VDEHELVANPTGRGETPFCLGIAGLVGGVVVQVIPKLLSRPKYTMIGGQFCT